MFPKQKILVVGDVMLDRTLQVSPVKIAPEYPSLVVKHTGGRIALGGAANVAANIAMLGGAVQLIGEVGNDWPAQQITNLCAGLPFFSLSLAQNASVTTVVKTRVVAGAAQLLRIDDDGPLTGTGVAARFRAAMINWQPTAIVVSDYDKGTCSKLLLDLKSCSELYKVPVYIDAKDLSLYGGMNAVATPNLKEALAHTATVVHPALAEQSSAADKGLCAGMHILKEYGYRAVAVTLGAAGAALCTAEQQLHVPALPITEVDVTGAGDVFIAGLALRGCDKAGVEFANVAAALAVAKAGTATVTAPEVDKELAGYVARAAGQFSAQPAT